MDINNSAPVNNSRPTIIIFAVIILLVIGFGVLFFTGILTPDSGKNVKKGLTDEEKAAIEQSFGASGKVLSEDEKSQIEKQFIGDSSKNALSDSEKRAIEQKISQ